MAGLAGESGGIVWESKDGFAVLAPRGPDVKMDQARELEQAGRWQEVVSQYAPEAGFSIGIAEFHTGMFWQFAKVYGQARTAVELSVFPGYPGQTPCTGFYEADTGKAGGV